MQQTIIGAGIFAGIFFVILLFYNNEKKFERHRELSNAEMDQQILDYEKYLSKSAEDLAQHYIESLSPLVIPDETMLIEQQTDVKSINTGIAELDHILNDPSLIEKSDLKFPYKHNNLRNAIGNWRCRHDDKLSAHSVIYNYDLHRNKVGILDSKSISCSHLESAEVIRTGDKLGGWLIHFKDVEVCPFYIISSSGSSCATSLKMYLAQAIVRTNSWEQTLKLNEDVIIEGMSSVKSMPLEQAVNEVFKGYSDRKYSHEKDKEPLVLKQASEAHIGLLKSLSDPLPKMVLSPSQTFSYFKNNYLSLVRLWDGEKFNTVRVTPQMYSDSVVVVAEHFLGTRLIEINSNDEQAYIDMSERKAFVDFESWIKYLLAKRRLFESGHEFKHFLWD